ncbi:hypothetical protein Chor_015476 [Crotalus horridus]
MAAMEKLMRAFEALRSFQQQPPPPPPPPSPAAPAPEEPPARPKKELSTSKKDRVNHCLTICENIVAQSLRNSPEFPKLLGIAMELFLLCSDDAESDVRMVADECLNKVIKNGASRSLRAALWRFAELAHLVRPQKCRPYFVNLLPCLTRVSRRPEESVQETLAAAMPKIMAAFGNFANDGDIKVLLKAFIGNLNSNSPTIRRTAAAATVSICQHSRRTQYFYTRLLQVLLGLLCPKEEEHPSVLILGVLLTLRYLIPLLQQQVYELSLQYTQHRDHNVVTGSLELLQQLLRTPPPNLLLVLTMRGGLLQASAAEDEIVSRSRSDSIVELIAGGGSSCSPVFSRKQKGEEEGLEEDTEARSETSQMDFAGSVKSELSSELAPTSGLATAAVSASDPPACDIITEQPRSQHVLQSESELPACDPTGAAPRADADDEILSRSSSQISAIQSDVNDGTSSPISDSSQTTTEGPDSAVTPSDFSEMLSRIKGDIGGYQDGSAAPLVHCVRLLSASFLLTGEKGEEQYVKDIVNYIDHGDPQIRGTTAILCGTIIYSILVQSCFSVESWLENIKASPGNRGEEGHSFVPERVQVKAKVHSLCCSSPPDTLVDCISLLQKTLKDESSVTLIQFLEERDSSLHRGDHHYTGVSKHQVEAEPTRLFLTSLFPPQLLKLQDRVLKEVVISLLGDKDPRVRRVAAAALVRLVPKLFYSCDGGQADPVVALAKEQSSVYLKLLMHETPPASQFAVSTITRTYRGYNLMQSPADVMVENNLSRVISAVSHALTTSPSRSLTFGCCEALCLLSSSFPVCTWNVGWHCGFSLLGGVEEPQEKSTIGMVGLLLSLLSSVSFPLDLSAHQDALVLAGNLLAASASKSLQNPWTHSEDEASVAAAKQEDSWAALADQTLALMVDHLFSHLLKVINICSHILDDAATLPSLTNPPSLSPIRRKGKEKDVAEQATVAISPKKTSENSPAPRQSDIPSSAPPSKSSSTLGNFYHLPAYLKLYDVLKATYANYKYVEEILCYLKSCFNKEPVMATVCVQQLLKTLFGTNLASQFDSWSSNSCRAQGKCQRLGSSNLRPGLYHCCFMAPYTQFTQALADASLRNMMQAEQERDTSGWFDILQKVSAQLKTGTTNMAKHRADKNIIHNHIRLFEPLVIKALKQYTTTTSVQLQRQVLDLLAQLVQLRVNYCLLDSDQVFIGFVLKQFEYIEVGQFRESEAIIPSVFFFLVLLSYERYHSKQIIGIPKIIQLCDGIMASGRKAVTHAIPALQPIVHDLFILRGANKADAGKELETQKEVVVSMLLRLIQYHQVLEMFILVLQQCHRENEEKWKRLSRQMQIDSHEALGILNTLFEILAPSALRPVDMLLRSMFVTPSTMVRRGHPPRSHLARGEGGRGCPVPAQDVPSCPLSFPGCRASVSTVQLWVSGILAILRVLISQSTEDIVLSRIQELSFSPRLISCQTIHRLRNGGNRVPATQETPPEEHDRFLPEETFSRFLMQLVGILLEDITSKQLHVEMSEQQHTFYCQELGTLLICLIHTFKSGMFRRITAAATKLFTGNGAHSLHFYTLERLNDLVKSMIATHPSLVLLWCQILLLVNYTDSCWWSKVHQTPKRQSLSSAKLLSPQACGGPRAEDGSAKLSICNREICQNLHDSEHLTWLTVNHVQELISLSHEPPVQDFISAIHRNSAASGLFIQAIQSRCENFASPTAVKKTLQCLEGIHLSQSGAVLVLYVDKLLSTPFRVLAHMVDTLACRRVEMLLAASVQNSTAQLPVEELDRIQEYLQNTGLAHRHQRLYSLLDRFRLTVAPETISPSPLVTAHPLDGGNHPALETLIPDKDWYCSLVRSQCYTKSAFALPEGAELMNRLPEQELVPFMMHQDFNIGLLAPCLSLAGQELSRGMRTHFEAARLVTLHQVTEVVCKLPANHQVFQPMRPMGSSPYWNKLGNIYGDPETFQFTMVLAQALSQYLVSLSKLPASLRIPHEKESDIVKFVVMLLEVPLSIDLQAVLECCCLALQQTELWNLWATTEYTSHSCSLIHCTRFILEAVAIEPGNRLLSPDKGKRIQKAASENDGRNSETPNSEYITATCEVVAELVECLQSVLALGHKENRPIPAFLTPVLKNIIISLSRLPLVNSYARVPFLVQFFQEREIFKEFIYRINTLGKYQDWEGVPAMKAEDFGWFGRKLNIIRGTIEQEIQELASKRDNVACHHLYQVWDPVPSLAPSTTGALISHEKLLLQINTEREMGNMGYKLGQEAPRRGGHPFVFSVPAGIVQSVDSPIQREQEDAGHPDQRSGPIRKRPLLHSRKSRLGTVESTNEFRSKNQFEMMYTTLTELRKVHPSEDEILLQYLVPALCKAAADKAVAEPVSRLLESTLRSAHMPSRIGALHGILYILDCVNLHNQQHILVMCAVAFYLIENYPADVGPEFSSGIIQQLSQLDCEALVKLSVDRVNVLSPHRAMAALGLMLSCMYTGKEKVSPGRSADHHPAAPDSESVIVAMERVSVLFDRIRKGFPFEARVVTRILPQFLDDFFPPQDVMNKVIGEFLSNQQPYPQFMAKVLYKISLDGEDGDIHFSFLQKIVLSTNGDRGCGHKLAVFQTLHTTGQSSMVRDWVMLSLSNFTQRTPIAMAMWSLSCFFVSASTSQWISGILPHIISRMGKSEQIDVNLFCLVAIDFYRHQIDEELDRRAFQSIFEVVSSPGNPYHRLLTCLQSVHKITPC